MLLYCMHILVIPVLQLTSVNMYSIVPNFRGVEFLRIDHQPRNFEKLQILKNLAPRRRYTIGACIHESYTV